MLEQDKSVDFVSLFVNHYLEYESPLSFWRWAAYSTIGAVLKTNVWFQHGNFRIYPNTYIIFLADSAQYRKGQPIEVARRLIGLLKHTKIFSGTASIQAILDLLSQDIANKTTGIPIKGGSALITADELASFFVADPRLIPLLTDIWSPRTGDDVYEYHLRSQNSIIIKNLCVSMLAASNETFLRDVYDSRAVYGGLLGRTFMIKPDSTRPANSLMNERESYDEMPLVAALTEIKNLAGKVTFTSDAKASYTIWYNDLYEKYKTHPDRTGVLQRMHTNAIKLSIILAAAKYTTEVTQGVIDEAILEVVALKQNYELYVMSSGTSDQAAVGTKFLAMALEMKNYTISRKEFLFKHWNDVKADEFDILIKTLSEGGMIEATVKSMEVAYKLTEKCINTMRAK